MPRNRVVRRPERPPGPPTGTDGLHGPATATWTALVAEIGACRRCPLGATRARPVIYRGPAAPEILVVGEAPGSEEDRQGIPFVGRGGKLLDAALATLPGAPRSVGVLNVVKCHPPGNRLPPASIAACRPFLERQLAELQPRLLVTLGAHALRALDPAAPRLTASDGHLRRAGPVPLFPIVHPAATFRARKYAERWAADWDGLRATLAAG